VAAVEATETFGDSLFAQSFVARQPETMTCTHVGLVGTMEHRSWPTRTLQPGHCHTLVLPRITDYRINGGRNLTAGRNEPMEPFAKALEVVTDVMRAGAASHPNNDWIGRSPEYHIARAEEHLLRRREGDQQEDHLSHAVTRLLMALTLRELA
jgi:hypothetical protein